MWKLLATLIALYVCLFAAAAAATVTAVIDANRVSCYAPCAVHFDGFTSSSDSNRAVAGDRFTDDLFVWDFDDDSAGNWSTSGEDMNVAYGPQAVHIFDPARWSDSYDTTCDGVDCKQYVVSMSMGNAEGDTDVADTVTISVKDPNDSAGLTTFCYSNAGSCDGACPAGATCRNTESNFADAITADGGNSVQILFETGDTFTVDAGDDPVAINFTTFRIGKYGSGAKPIIDDNGTTSDDEDLFSDASADDVVVANLDVNGAGTEFITTSLTECPTAACGSDYLMYYLNDVSGYTKFIWMGSGGGAPEPDDFSVVENTYDPACGDNTSFEQDPQNGAFFWMYVGDRPAILGNSISGTANRYCAEHTLRFMAYQRATISHNFFDLSGAGKATVSLRGCDTNNSGCDGTSQYMLFSYNELARSGTTQLFGYHSNQDSQCARQHQKYAVLEANYLRLGEENVYLNSQNQWPQAGMYLQEPNVTARNNVCAYRDTGVKDSNNAACVRSLEVRACDKVDDHQLWNNSFWWLDDTDSAIPCTVATVRMSGGDAGDVCGNNIYYNPEFATECEACENTTGTDAGGNIFRNSGDANPFTSAGPPTELSHFKIASDDADLDTGIANNFVLIDAGGNCRDESLGGDTPNPGAWEENEAGATVCSLGSEPTATPTVSPTSTATSTPTATSTSTATATSTPTNTPTTDPDEPTGVLTITN